MTKLKIKYNPFAKAFKDTKIKTEEKDRNDEHQEVYPPVLGYGKKTYIAFRVGVSQINWFFFFRVENNLNSVAHENNFSMTTDDWLAQYGGQREMMTRCQCSSCYFAKPQVSHKKCATIYSGQEDDHTVAYQAQAAYSWTQLGG